MQQFEMSLKTARGSSTSMRMPSLSASHPVSSPVPVRRLSRRGKRLRQMPPLRETNGERQVACFHVQE